jgi:hypothetical protein
MTQAQTERINFNNVVKGLSKLVVLDIDSFITMINDLARKFGQYIYVDKRDIVYVNIRHDYEFQATITILNRYGLEINININKEGEYIRDIYITYSLVNAVY